MKTTQINIADLQHDPAHFGSLDLLLTVKSFDLQAIRKRYLASKARGTGRTGSVSRRKPSVGGVVSVRLDGNTIPHQEVVWQTKEPRGIDWRPGHLTVAAENTVFLLSDKGDVKTITNPWLSYIHTVSWNPHDSSELLISSSGLDMLQIYRHEQIAWEWLAWEHGFFEGYDTEVDAPILLTRNQAQATIWRAAGHHHMLVDSPANTHLPTAMRAAFINSAVFDSADPSSLLATFFHEGRVYSIDRTTGKARVVIDHLHHPHGGRRFGKYYIATSTASGEVVLQQSSEQLRYSLAGLPGKPDYLSDKEWAQNTITTESEWIIIDSNRTAFVRIDPVAQKYCLIPYSNDWAVQDGVQGVLTSAQKAQFKDLT